MKGENPGTRTSDWSNGRGIMVDEGLKGEHYGKKGE